MGDKHTVYRKKYKISDAYKNLPDVIVERAVARQGERKWHLIGNWSSHLVTECILLLWTLIDTTTVATGLPGLSRPERLTSFAQT